MTKIWSGGASKELPSDIDNLMVDEDVVIDRVFLEYEVLALLAYQVQMHMQNLLPKEDSAKIISALLSLLDAKIVLKKELEDVHGNVENYVLQKAGEAGKNLRMFLSRNEQIHTDILLYGRFELLRLASLSLQISKELLKKRDEVSGEMPGYTHYRQGMVISVKSYFDYFAAIFKESAESLEQVSRSIDHVPFGYGSGFGSLSDADFNGVSELLGLKAVKKNPQYLSLRRGMDEVDLVFPLLKLLLNISRISQDLIMFSGDEMPLFTLPEGFVTGSSLMANKRNPDFLEMVQGYTSEIIGKFNSLLGMVANKSSGYHRDFQISKKILVNIFQRVKMILDPLPDFFSGLTVNSGAAGLSIKNSSYATANAKAMFSLGASWKDSYSQVGKRILEGEKLDEIKPGSILSVDESDIRAVEDSVESGIKEIIRAREDLIGKARKLLDR
ncbi:hypothetical protein IX51_10825 [uncultured archaeon]|nr:hypothetical protein IX51_10825 [uncultured archaeon]